MQYFGVSLKQYITAEKNDITVSQIRFYMGRLLLYDAMKKYYWLRNIFENISNVSFKPIIAQFFQLPSD